MKANWWKRLAAAAAGAAAICMLTLNVRAIDLNEISHSGSEYDYDDAEDEDAFQVPGEGGTVIRQVTLKEKYHKEYELYEESLGDVFFFYCNVSNGSFSTVPVSFDIPSNLSFVLEKNGAEIAYKSGDKITAKDNYVLRLRGEYENIVYLSTFRFTIREAVSAEAGTQDEKPETAPAAQEPGQDGEGSPEDDLELDPTEDIDRDKLNEAIEEIGNALEESPDGGVSGGLAEAFLGMTQRYDESHLRYRHLLLSGSTVFSNVPNGAIVNGDVVLELPDTVQPTVYRNGEKYEISGTNFTEEGIYRIVFYEPTLNFALAYPDETSYPFLMFRIVKNAVNDLQIFNAPLGGEILQVICDFETLYMEGEATEDGRVLKPLSGYELTKEGVYQFVIRDRESGNKYTCNVEYDTTGPQFSISVKNGKASVNYLSNDAAAYELQINGVKQDEFSIYKFASAGNYVFRVTDLAGNTTTAAFTLKSAVNYGTVSTILILIALAVTLTVFVRRMRSIVKIR